MSTVTELFNSDSLAARVAARVRGMAAERGVMQKDIAAWLGLPKSQVSGRFSGRIEWKLDELDILATKFGVDPADFLPRKPSSEVSEEMVRRQGLEPRTRWFGAARWSHTSPRRSFDCSTLGEVIPLEVGRPRRTHHTPHPPRRRHTRPFSPLVADRATAG